jgi:hypothetical protein
MLSVPPLSAAAQETSAEQLCHGGVNRDARRSLGNRRFDFQKRSQPLIRVE